MFARKRMKEQEEGMIGLIALFVLLLVVLASLAMLVLLGALVFTAGLPLGIVLVLGLLFSWFGPGWMKLLGAIMVFASILIALWIIVM